MSAEPKRYIVSSNPDGSRVLTIFIPTENGMRRTSSIALSEDESQRLAAMLITCPTDEP